MFYEEGIRILSSNCQQTYLFINMLMLGLFRSIQPGMSEKHPLPFSWWDIKIQHHTTVACCYKNSQFEQRYNSKVSGFQDQECQVDWMKAQRQIGSDMGHGTQHLIENNSLPVGRDQLLQETFCVSRCDTCAGQFLSW